MSTALVKKPHENRFRSQVTLHGMHVRITLICKVLAWVSGVSGEKGKDGSEKGRETFPPAPPPSKISSPLAP